MSSTRSLTLATILAAVFAVTVVAVAQATPAVGQHPTTPVIGTLTAKVDVNTDRIKFQTKDPTDVATFMVTYDPDGFSGWHTHPGILLVTVQSGSVVRTVGCSSTTYGPGETFVESDEQAVGAVRNPSHTTDAVLWVTQVVPKGSPRRANADAPNCP
jgi:quercetin dioxygenase-like cupin family protein